MQLNFENKKDISAIKQLLAKNDQAKPIYSNGCIDLFYGDNFQIMGHLLNEYANKIDLVYIDPPYNTGQIFKISENKTATISSSLNDEIAYFDNMKFNDYLEYIRERLVAIYCLLSDQGTLYVHIDIKVGHYIKILLDEIFGAENFINEISRIKSNPKNFNKKAFGNFKDTIYIYSKKPKQNIFNNILQGEIDLSKFPKKDENGAYTTVPCHAPGETKNGVTANLWKGLLPPKGRHWRYAPEKLTELDREGLIEWSKNGNPRIKRYAKDFRGVKLQDVWLDYKDPACPTYPTEKNSKMLDMIIKQSSNENSIIMDCFCGSGSFLLAGFKNSRKVIGIDNSKQAINVAIKNLQNELGLFAYNIFK